jgi:hypothetical protein
MLVSVTQVTDNIKSFYAFVTLKKNFETQKKLHSWFEFNPFSHILALTITVTTLDEQYSRSCVETRLQRISVYT